MVSSFYRDKLGQLARKGDARDRLQKIKNLREGKLEVKAIGRGSNLIVFSFLMWRRNNGITE